MKTTIFMIVKHVPDTFELEFQSCYEGYNYVEDFGPEEYAETPNAKDLKRYISTND